ncbi:MAG: CoA transferase [Clostridiales bacterium]|nr:CoA transferase [Clostridiales bacterium]
MEQNTSLPLKGVRVLELSTVVAAPTVGRIMATYGADVIKVEPPNGDLLRPVGRGQYLPAEANNNPLFDLFNTGKKMVVLNLKKPAGMEAFHKLLAGSNVFISNIRAQSLTHLGLDYDTLKGKYPRLICAHFSGFGLKGPDVERPGFDSTAFWLRTGPSQDWLTPGAFPMRPAFAFGDLATASSFLSGILMALYARGNTGHGTLVETSLQGSGIWCSASAVLNSQYGKGYPSHRNEPWDPFSDYYRCADGEWLAVMEKEYSRDKATLAKILDMPELITDPELLDLPTMRQYGRLQGLSRKMEALMRTKPCAYWEQLFDANDIPNERLRHYRDVCHDEQALANDCFDYVTYPDGKTAAMPVPPIAFSDYARLPTAATTPMGQDTDTVLAQLGYTEPQIAALRDAGAI